MLHTPKPTCFSDEELVRLYLHTQHNRYFEQLYTRYYHKVLKRCVSLTKDPILAQDLVQDIFIRTQAKLNEYRHEAKFSTWLYAITYNHCCNQVRLRKARPELVPTASGLWPEIATEDGLSEQAERQALQLREALGQLSREAQAMLVMKYEHNLSLREIALVTGTTESAVKSRLMRLRSRLRQTYLQQAPFE